MLKIKRIMAFLIDAIFISFLVTLLINSPLLKNYTDTVNAYNQALLEKVNNLDYDYVYKEEDPNKYLQEYVGQSLYDNVKINVYIYIIYLSAHFLYFVVFAFFNQGRTLGCVFMKLKVVNNKNTKPSIINLSLRSLFLGADFIYFFPLTAIINIIVPRVLPVNLAYYPIISISAIMGLFQLVMLIIFLVNKEGKALHDYIGGTKVLEYKR